MAFVAAAVDADAVRVCNGLGFDLFSLLDSSHVIIRIRKHKKRPQIHIKRPTDESLERWQIARYLNKK